MDHLDLSFVPERKDPFKELLLKTRDKFGLDHVAYAGFNPISGTTHGHVTYDDRWTQHYASQGFFRIDPTLIEARRSVAPVDWSRLEHTANFKAVFRDAHDFGITDTGLTIPVRGPYGDIGGLSVTSELSQTEWGKLKRHIISDLQQAAANVHDLVMQANPLMQALTSPQLSTREVEILQWTAAGKSQQDIGDILSISHRTVEVHLRSSRQKLHALTTAQAVGRAIALGIVGPG
ncbi:LuxR family transcriptional regulator [uncultured Roseovarius sp.]|uniref:helix-turn-helix transcriptional regulator n=1 Tax=uncultured Roseovarius sp. TaxID=293344 RepID=UPI0026297E4E|nr:LuxR family transcriptional regulator [uncultured Roseovarius sp.]